MLGSEVAERVPPPVVVTDGGQHSLGGQAGGGQHLHGPGRRPVEEVPAPPH